MKSTRNDTTTERFTGAWRVLRGRPPKPDFGLLLVLPFLAAAGGALVGLALESLIARHRRRPVDSSRAASPRAASPRSDSPQAESPSARPVSAQFEARRTRLV